MAQAVRTREIAVERRRGRPTIVFGGEPLNPQTYRIHDRPLDARYLRRFVDAGIRLYFLDFTDEPALPESVHFDRVDERMRALLALAPDLLVIPSIRFLLSEEWAAAHSEALCRFEDGTLDHFMGQSAPEQRYTMASPVWEAEVARILTAHVRHFESADYAGNVIGYHIRCGHCGEWNFWWDIADSAKHGIDYSDAMVEWFRTWLARRYGDDAGLRRAWADPNVTLATALPPSVEDRNSPDVGEFFTPDGRAGVLDFVAAMDDVAAERAVNLCKVVKDTAARNVLAGVFNGGFRRAVGKLLRSPYVDFLASPPPYENRGPGDYSPLHTTTESVALHGKIWITEADNRTHLSDQYRYGATDDRDSALEAMARDWLNMQTHGVMSWWYDFSRNWYDDEIMRVLARLQQLSEAGLGFEYESAAGLALVLHRGNARVTNYRVARYTDYQDELGLDRNLTTRQIVQEMGRIGAPWDFYSLDDLAALPSRRHRVYWFLNAFMLDDRERAKIDALKSDGNVLVFFYAPGWLHPDRRPAADVAHMIQVTGLEFKCIDESRSLVSRITASGARWLPGIDEGFEFGEFKRPLKTGFEIDPNRPNRLPPVIEANPVFCPESAGSVVLGRYAADNRASFVMRQFDDWTSVYIGATSVPAALVRALIARAGVHLYGEEDTITYADNHFVGIHSSRAGRHVIELPEPRAVADALECTMLGEELDRIEMDMAAEKTKIFVTGSTGEVKRFMAVR